MDIKQFSHYSPKKKSATLPEAASTTEDDEDSYLPSDGLAAAVNVALTLSQPLLVTGEPGTGKTRLAYHLARYFGLGKLLVFNAQTTSIKKDLFYTYDALGHFHYTQINKEVLKSGEMEQKFIRYEALGKAIRLAADEKKPTRSVVLIDEIDKAPRDLPNDLLVAIETLTFDVPELPGEHEPQTCPKNFAPIIVITSNSEKNLPEAFLRRVVYHDIKFPDDTALLKILQSKQLINFEDEALNTLIKHFGTMRIKPGIAKKPATAELIAWATLLSKLKFPIEKLNNPEKLKEEEKQLLYTSYGVLAKTKEDLEKMTGQ